MQTVNTASVRVQNTHTHPFNGPFSGTTRVSRYQKGKTNLDFTETRDSEWQWHQLGHMQVCISLQTDTHASTTPLVFYRPDALPATQPTASKHWRQKEYKTSAQNNIWLTNKIDYTAKCKVHSRWNDISHKLHLSTQALSSISKPYDQWTNL